MICFVDDKKFNGEENRLFLNQPILPGFFPMTGGPSSACHSGKKGSLPSFLLNVPGSNGFCGFRYDPQMNADERRQTLTACAAGQSAGASAFIRGLQ